MEHPEAERPNLEQLLDELGYQPRHADWLFMRSLGSAHQQKLLARLAGLLEIRRGKTVEKASETAGVSVPTMYRLKKLWQNEDGRTLESLASFVVRRVRGPGRKDRLQAAREVARRLAGRGGMVDDLSTKAFAHLVQERSPDRISMTAALAIARDARRRGKLTAGRLATDYGRTIVLDSCAVSLTLAPSAGHPSTIAILALVVEAGAGLILAANVSDEREAARSQEKALEQARQFIAAEGIDVAEGKPADLHVVVGPDGDVFSAMFRLAMVRRLGSDSVTARGVRRFGRAAIDVIGPDLGRLRLLPAATQGGSVSAAAIRTLGRNPVPLEVAQSVVDRTVKAHNAPILKKLRSLAILAPGGEGGIMEAALANALHRPPPPRTTRIIL
ncbi:hypothetical protein [Sphingomonas sp. CFBP 8760]|uniref:hypothetical protein n=1 Tax=Sphingomonas sp. CFBP 8760 TaxID=2775282 RepID=UPI00177AD5ED|nr:hypothetical protein [Sphingomonas sp. CFBP 8760]MBD8548835.1 hypothetical protein [Sphingomonas sp. CFBP 8760]